MACCIHSSNIKSTKFIYNIIQRKYFQKIFTFKIINKIMFCTFFSLFFKFLFFFQSFFCNVFNKFSKFFNLFVQKSIFFSKSQFIYEIPKNLIFNVLKLITQSSKQICKRLCKSHSIESFFFKIITKKRLNNNFCCNFLKKFNYINILQFILSYQFQKCLFCQFFNCWNSLMQGIEMEY
ncbi:hypothetical protein IMG5_014370 [Ichthyophthirius multifiliis]|uniref:Transmembrane protein n=1 Tax=Ichthyophthirius multifiliis TaxID=5932 RepID=G0QK83_ICHMU|nr:hypothetical protein IMG5_014370 [Ichthyophthirius multifiliis]EGR34372.1 hypothetical protein IMG5_014370 [Ichthyophthirius multifiliis]|eukprot:XP_004039676.1 hypothetical protein IMG5_014370 [Ichthyophthirius multifiliis]